MILRFITFLNSTFSYKERKKIANSNLFTFLLYVLLTVFFFYYPFHNYYFSGDFKAFWLPSYHFLLSNLKMGIIPLWQPFSYLGVPFFFKSDLLLFYPVTWITLLVNLFFNPTLNFDFLGKSLEISQYIHIVIGCFGMYLLLRRKFSFSVISSFLGGVVFGFGLFLISQLQDMSSLQGKAYLPLLIYALITFIEQKNFKNLLLLVGGNYLLLSFGYPYYYVYFFIAEMSLASLYGLKHFFRIGYAIGLSMLLAGVFLLPNIYIDKQSYRGIISTISDPFFHFRSAFIPTRIINILNPQIFANFYDKKDPYTLFSMGILNWGIFPLLFLIKGFTLIGKSKLHLWVVGVFCLSLLVGLGGYLNIPNLFGLLIPPLQNFRSHWQVLILTYFSGVIVITYGIEATLKGIQSKKIEFFLWQIFIFLVVYLAFIPFWCRECTANSLDVVISSARTFIIFGLSTILFSLAQKYAAKSFIILGMIIFLIESGFYFSNLPGLNNPNNYSSFFKENSLILEKPTNKNLFRYAFLNDQFQYNTSSLNIPQFYGYETVPYPANFSLDRYPFGESMRVSNVKYVVTTDGTLESKYPQLHLVKSIDPSIDKKEIFYSDTKDSTEINPGSKNDHFVYIVAHFLPRYFIPNEVTSCPDNACLTTDDPSKISYVAEKSFHIANPLARNVNITIASYTANTIKLLINTPKETFISSSEIFDEGWNIDINGKKSKVINTNAGFRGFLIPKGSSEVQMSYTPPFFKEGIFVTLLGLFLLAVTYRLKLLKIRFL